MLTLGGVGVILHFAEFVKKKKKKRSFNSHNLNWYNFSLKPTPNHFDPQEKTMYTYVDNTESTCMMIIEKQILGFSAFLEH